MGSSGDPEVDRKSLPPVVALDAGVLMLALNQKVHRPDTPACRALWLALTAPDRLNSGGRVLIPAPVLAEIMRGTKPTDPPRIQGIHVASFTSRAARLLATHLPHSFIERQVSETSLPRAYLKYDSLIIAIALAYDAMLVTLDKWVYEQKHLPIAIKYPSELTSRQRTLPLGP